MLKALTTPTYHLHERYSWCIEALAMGFFRQLEQAVAGGLPDIAGGINRRRRKVHALFPRNRRNHLEIEPSK
jgi:hypothetical protein